MENNSNIIDMTTENMNVAKLISNHPCDTSAYLVVSALVNQCEKPGEI